MFPRAFDVVVAATASVALAAAAAWAQSLPSPAFNVVTANAYRVGAAPGVDCAAGSTVTAAGGLVTGCGAGGGPAYTLPVASTTTLGGVMVDGTSISATPGGVISAVGGSGAGVATVATDCPVVAGVSGAVVVSGKGLPVSITAATDTIGSSACGTSRGYAAAGGTTVNVGSAVTLTAGFWVDLQANFGAGTVTLLSAGGNFLSTGSTTLTLTAGQSCVIMSDAANWKTFCGKGSGGSSFPTPTRAGDVIYWNGSVWTNLAGNNSGTNFLQENASGVPSWVAASGACSGSFCSLTAGANWVAALSANLGSGWTAALAATYAPGGAPAAVPPAKAWYPWGWFLNTNGTAQTISTIICAPMTFDVTHTIDKFSAFAQTVGATNVAYALYIGAADATVNFWQPLGAPVATTGLVPDNVAALDGTISGPAGITSYQVSPGVMYFLCQNFGDSTVVMKGLFVGTASSVALMGATTSAGAAGANPTLGLQAAATSTIGTWPTFAAGSGVFAASASAKVPAFAYHVLSIP